MEMMIAVAIEDDIAMNITKIGYVELFTQFDFSMFVDPSSVR